MERDAPSKAGWLRRLGRNVALLSGTCAVLLLLTEVTLRIVDPEVAYVVGRTWPAGYFDADSELGIVHAPNVETKTFRFRGNDHEIFTNSLGCFDHDAPIDSSYVLVLGDSFAWGYAPLEDKWTTRLETLSGRRVVKCGVSGTGPRYQLAWGRRVVRAIGHRPALVIYLYSVHNDLNDDVVFPGYTLVEGRRVNTLESLDLRSGEIRRRDQLEIEARLRDVVEERSAVARWVERSALLRYAYHFRFVLENREPARGLAGDGDTSTAPPVLTGRYARQLLDVDPKRYPWIEVALAGHLENLRAIERQARSWGARCVFVTFDLETGGLHDRLRRFFEMGLQHVHDLDVDLATESGERSIFYRYDGHWNAWGNRLAGESIHAYLKRSGLLSHRTAPTTLAVSEAPPGR